MTGRVCVANDKPFWYQSYPGETSYVAGTANVKRMLQDMLSFVNFYLKGMPHGLPDVGNRPLISLSRLIPEKIRTDNIRFSRAASGVPPKDMAN